MKVLWFLAYLFQLMSFTAWLVNAPAQTWHGIVYYPQLLDSAMFVVICAIVKLLSGPEQPPKRPA